MDWRKWQLALWGILGILALATAPAEALPLEPTLSGESMAACASAAPAAPPLSAQPNYHWGEPAFYSYSEHETYELRPVANRPALAAAPPPPIFVASRSFLMSLQPGPPIGAHADAEVLFPSVPQLLGQRPGTAHTPQLRPLRPPPETNRPVLGAPQTFAAIRPVDDSSNGSAPISLADGSGRVLVGADAAARFRYLVLRGGRIGELSLRVSQRGAVLELDAIQFAIRRALEVTDHATVITHIREYPAGLDLAGDALLNLDGGRLQLLFHMSPADEGVHWGLRARGDWQDRFYRLIQDRQITVGAVELGRVTPAEPLVIFDGEYTYITLGPPVYESPIQSQVRFAVMYEPARVPEPLTIALLGLGAVGPLRRRRR